MNSNPKLKALEAMYNIYEKSIENMDFACEEHCSHCCSCNLVVTSLETYKILFYLKEKKNIDLTKASFPKNEERFLPSITINQMAEMCSLHQDIPEENINHKSGGECPFLLLGKCSIYEVRPFGCRCMLSTNKCSKVGYAVVDPYLLTMNSIFTQYIEHIDFSGYTSNLTDMILTLSVKDNLVQYQNGLELMSINLIKNRVLRTLMIPPEHVKQVQPLLENIRNIET